jgi:hypothetical protein
MNLDGTVGYGSRLCKHRVVEIKPDWPTRHGLLFQPDLLFLLFENMYANRLGCRYVLPKGSYNRLAPIAIKLGELAHNPWVLDRLAIVDWIKVLG